MKLSGVRYLIKQGVDNVWKNRVMAFASFCVLLVSLLLVGISCLFLLNLNSIIGGIEDKNEVIIYIKDNTSDQQIQEMGKKLEQMDNVSSVSFYSKEDAYEAALEQLSRQLERAQNRIREQENRLGGYQRLYDSKMQKLAQQRKDWEAATLRLREKQQRRRLLQDLENSMEGFGRSIKEILRAGKSGRISGITAV